MSAPMCFGSVQLGRSHMRMLLAAAALAAIPLISNPVHAANNDLAGQAQRFLGNGNSDDQERAYERGRRDEDMRNRQAQRDRDRYDNGYRDRDSRYGDRRDYPNNQYPNNYR